MLTRHCSIHRSTGFSLLSSFHGDNSGEWAVRPTPDAVEDCVCICVCCMIFYVLCHYLNIPFSLHLDIKSLRRPTREQIETKTYTFFPGLDVISLLTTGLRANISNSTQLIAHNIHDNELHENTTRFSLSLSCLFVSLKRGLENSHLIKCYSLKKPLNLNRLVQYWCGWKCERTRDELQPAVGLLWYFHRGIMCTRRIGVILRAKARQSFICGDEMWILQRANIQLEGNGVKPVLWYRSCCMEPYIILPFVSLSNKGDDVDETVAPLFVVSNCHVHGTDLQD